MSTARVAYIPLGSQFKLSTEDYPFFLSKNKDMVRVSYTSYVGSVMYSMICTRPDLAYTLSFFSRCMSNPSRSHLDAI